MGLGKTFAGSEKMFAFNERVNLVVCQKSKVKDWISHLYEFYSNDTPTDCAIYDLTNTGDYKKFFEQVAAKTDKLSIVGVINYELIYRRPEILKLKGFTVLYDESSMLKNEQSKRAKAALKLKSAHNILLSGTPVGGKYEELWSQCRLLGWKISKKDFWSRYVITTDYFPVGACYPIKLVSGYKNIEELKSYLRYFGADFLKAEDVLTLPEQNFINYQCEVTSEYHEFEENGLVSVDGVEIVGDTPFSKLTGLRILASAYCPSKLERLKTILESTDDRLIIFYNFWDEFNKIVELCKGRHISAVNGKTFDLNAYEQCNDSVTLVQYQAGAMGLNLQKSHTIIYFSPSLSSELFEQSKKRIHRLGQRNTCFYYTLSAGIESHIYEVLARREDFTAQLFVKPKED